MDEINLGKPSKLKMFLYFIIGLVVGIGLSFLLTYIMLVFKNEAAVGSVITFKEYAVPLLLDGFSFAAIFYLCFGGFAYISLDVGLFDIVVFAFKKFGSSLWFRSYKLNKNMPKTFYDYKMEKVSKPVPYYMWLVWDGLVLLTISLILFAIYMANPILYY